MSSSPICLFGSSNNSVFSQISKSFQDTMSKFVNASKEVTIWRIPAMAGKYIFMS